MKRLALFFVVFFLALALVAPASAAIPITATWEVRPSVGSDTNGGGFIPNTCGGSTDYSQQNTKNTAGSNISTTDAVAAGTTTITSVTGAFTSVLPCNLVYFAGGTGTITGQWREVLTVVNATTITIDASIAASTGMTMNIGGALATPLQAYTNSVGGNTIYGKATASYTVTSAQTFATGNSEPITFIGYTSTRGDNGQFTWTTSTNSIDLLLFNGASNYVFQNVIFSTTAGTPGIGLHAGNPGPTSGLVHLINCSVQGFSAGIDGFFSQEYSFVTLLIENTEITGSVGAGIENSGQTVIVGSFIHGNGGDGVVTDSSTGGVSGPWFIAHSIIKSNGGKGVNFNANNGNPGTNSAYQWPVMLNNDVINNTGDGIAININQAGDPGSLLIWNNVIDSNGGFGVNAVGTPAFGIGLISFRNNAFRNNTSGNYNQVPAGTGDVSLSADPFVNRASNNFALNSTSGGGAACKQAGFPGVLQIGGTGYIDIGALQSQGGAGPSASPVGFVAQ